MTQASKLLIQLTDTHCFADATGSLAGVACNHTLAAIVQQISQQHPKLDAIFLTGDLVQDHTPQAYQRLKALLAPLSVPVYWTLGNHDTRTVAYTHFQGDFIHHESRLALGAWQLVAVDSVIDGQVSGYITDAEITKLTQTLAANPIPTIVGLHHPPIEINCKWLETICLQNKQAFLEALQPFPWVKVVLFGHIHQDFVEQHEAICFMASPSTCVQFKPHSDEFLLDCAAPGYRWIELYPDGRFATGVSRLQGFDTAQVDVSCMGY